MLTEKSKKRRALRKRGLLAMSSVTTRSQPAVNGSTGCGPEESLSGGGGGKRT